MYDEIGQGTYSIINKGIMQKDEYDEEIDEEIVLRIPKVMPLIEIVDGKEIQMKCLMFLFILILCVTLKKLTAIR
jgi:hypothetical protein